MQKIWDFTAFKAGAFEIMRGAHQAGRAILEIYRASPKVEYKADLSPVTDADRASEDIIVACLSKLMPGVPIVAEERTASGEVPQTGALFFLVDPLDGTKEFLKFNGEFAINIALVADGKPVFGLIYAPERSDCFVTLENGKAFRCVLPAEEVSYDEARLNLCLLNGDAIHGRPFKALVSRSNPRPEAIAFLEGLGAPERLALGSSLKFGLLASGEADVYPRFGPTSEWDTAAGHAILNATGGCIQTPAGDPLRYGKREEGFVNPSFIAWRRQPEPAG